MNNRIRIIINPDIEKTSFELLDDYNNNYILEISLNPKTNYDEIIIDNEIFKTKNIDKENFLNNIDYISFAFFNKYFEYVNKEKINMAVNNYLLMNKETFQNKRIVLPKIYQWNSNIKELKEKYKNYNNILVNVEGNIEPITLEEFEKSQKIFNSIVDIIKQNNYSPLEATIFIYDFVRSYHYQEQKKDESIFKSRDISKILLENKIVCTGYANLTRILLQELNISSKIYRLKDHDLIMIYLKDKKYNINGIYLSDPTAESYKKSDNYLYHYSYCLKTRDKMLSYYYYEKDETLFTLDHKETKDFVKEVKQILNNNDFFEQMQLKFTLDKLSYLVNGHSYIINDLHLKVNINDIKLFQRLLNKDISLKAFTNALQVVRQNKYYQEKNIKQDNLIIDKIAIKSDFYQKETIKTKIANNPLIKKLMKNTN